MARDILNKVFKEEFIDWDDVRPGAVENDTFVINDVALRISPSQINIEKTSFNKEWVTLRTRYPQKAKSGYGTLRITISLEFKLSNYEDRDDLSRLVAGLRTTPFCVVYSHYLDRMVGGPSEYKAQDMGERNMEDDTYNPYQPIMLALSTASFSTEGHASKPDCISGTLDFLYFNYLPYTNFISFKTGEENNQPGFPWQSKLWKLFYEPYYNNQVIPTYPHKNTTTTFIWREYLISPVGNPVSLEASEDLVKAIRNQPEKVLNIYTTMVGGNAARKTTNINNIDEKLINSLYRNLIINGVINPSDNIKTMLGFINQEGDTRGIEEQKNTNVFNKNSFEVIQSTVKQFIGGESSYKSSADTAIGIIKSRREDLGKIKKTSGNTEDLEAFGWNEILNTNLKSKVEEGGRDISIGGIRLFGRKNRLEIHHQKDDVTPSNIILQINVSFQHNLSILPMLGYSYPTIQHVGGMDAQVDIVFNSTRSGAQELRQMYDTIENSSLKFKRIPAAYNSLFIDNDFLKIFDLKEFVTNSIQIDTIEGSPNRSSVYMSLSVAGSKNEDVENITQELIMSSTEMQKEVWKVLKKNMEKYEGFSGKYEYDFNLASSMFIKPEERGMGGFSDLFSLTKKSKINQPNEVNYYKMKVSGVGQGGYDSLYRDLVNEAVNLYNEELYKLHKETSAGGDRTIQKTYFFLTLEQDGDFGFIPGLEDLKKSVLQRKKAEIGKVYGATEASVMKYIRDRTIADYNRLKVSEQAWKNLRNEWLRDAGIPNYASKAKNLLNKIVKSYLKLPKFKHLQDKTVSNGLNLTAPTYNDFIPSLTNVAGATEDLKNVTTDVLNAYEPDCYFYYSTINGGASSPFYGVIDSYYITLAQQHSKAIYDNAQTQIKDFFETSKNGIPSYQERLKSNTSHLGPYNYLIESNRGQGSKDTSPVALNIINERTEIQNYASAGHSKRTHLDSNIKAPTNWYSKRWEWIQCPNVCTHSTDFHDMWGGVSAGTGEITPAQTMEPLNKEQSSKTDFFHPDKLAPPKQNFVEQSFAEPDLKTYNMSKPVPTGQRISTANFKSFQATQADKKQLDLMWPSSPRTNVFTSGKLFGAARDGGTRVHKGIDISNNEKTPIYAAQEGEIVHVKNDPGGRGGIRVRIKHTKHGGWITDYMHLLANSVKVQPKQWVTKGQLIALMGNTGAHSTGDHLHFQVGKPGEIFTDPFTMLPEKMMIIKNTRSKFNESNQRYSSSITTNNESPMMLAIKEFERDISLGQAQSLMRAYPAFKLYFIEEDQDEEGKRFSFDDFFNYRAVQSIRVVKNKDIAADLCEIYLTNVSGVLTNTKFGPPNMLGHPTDKNNVMAVENDQKSGTKDENPIASLLLQEGMNISLKLGFSNNSQNLETVFNGIIMETEFADNDDLIRIVCQSYAVELVQDIKGLEKPSTRTTTGFFETSLFWGIGSEATTGRILEEMLSEPEVLHFGRWEPKSNVKNLNRNLLTDRWTFQPSPQDDNIFAPSINQDVRSFDEGPISAFYTKLKYIIYRTTIWDIVQEMLLRHPNFIASAVPYSANNQERMTLFFGLPNQLYFARDPNSDENIAQETLKKEIESFEAKALNSPQLKDLPSKLGYKSATMSLLEVEKELIKQYKSVGLEISSGDLINEFNKLGKESPFRFGVGNTTGTTAKAIENIHSNLVSKKRINQRLGQALTGGFIRPFRNYHLITSSQHIISNSVKASAKDVANTITVIYGKDIDLESNSSRPDTEAAIGNTDEEFTLKLDNALPPELIKMQVGEFVNATNIALAKRYALSMLANNLKNIYRGEIIIIGNPKVKVNDVVFVIDEVSDITGAFEVAEVQHSFDHEGGFITSITPNMLVFAADYSILSSIEAMGIVMEGFFRGDSKYSNTSTSSLTLSAGINTFGGTLARKIINFTQLAQPIIMCPLSHHGRPFTGGIPTRKISTSLWNTMLGNWTPETNAGFSEWVEEVGEGIINTVKKNFGIFMEGDFFNNE